MTRIMLSAVIMALCVVNGLSQECRMSRAFMQPDGNAPGGATAVWSDAGGSSLFFVESLNVNTDGTRRSYSVEDFWGKATALNNLCNAMSDRCAGLNTDQLRDRRITTQRAFANGWPADQLARTRISSSIIPFKGGKPCPLVGGYLVSATALHRPGVFDVCDITNYVDALEVPALVLPGNPSHGTSGFAQRGARVGDLVVAMTPGGTTPVYAVVGDIGPPRELGEASVAMNGKLLGKTAPPRNYDEVRGRAPFVGQGWGVRRALVLIFPSTRDVANPYLTTARIDENARRRFEEWGGVARLTACAAAYASH
ncbi:MAG TPA: hypothetical protein VF553_16215 [Pyrinomonadaceae bacterium]|jgi:hypothetical protein